MTYRLRIIGSHADCHKIWQTLVPDFVISHPLSGRYDVDEGQCVDLCADGAAAIGPVSLVPTPLGKKVKVIKAEEVLGVHA